MRIHGGKIVTTKKRPLALTLLPRVDWLRLLGVSEEHGLEVTMKPNIKCKPDDKVMQKENLPIVLTLD